MKQPKIRVDFNELVEDNLVLLSKHDEIKDLDGNIISLYSGMHVIVFEDDLDDNNMVDNLIAHGTVELNTYGDRYAWTAGAKWNCRINEKGVMHEPDFNSH